MVTIIAPLEDDSVVLTVEYRIIAQVPRRGRNGQLSKITRNLPIQILTSHRL